MNPSQSGQLTDGMADLNSLPLTFRAQLFKKNAEDALIQRKIDPLSTAGRQYLQQVDDAINNQFQMQNISSGQVPLTPEFANQNPQVANQLFGQGVKVTSNDKSAETTENLNDITKQLKEAYEEAEAKGPQHARVAESLSSVIGLLTNTSPYPKMGAYNSIRSGASTALTRSIIQNISGSTGVTGDAIIKRVEELLPTLYDDPDSAKAKFEKLEAFINIGNKKETTKGQKSEGTKVGRFTIEEVK